MAEWLGTGLQNPSRRFKSASDLKNVSLFKGGANPDATSQ